MILQHGGESEHYRLANALASEAMAGGHGPAKWLTAATEDRWLVSQNRPQRYGTQYVKAEGGEWGLAPVDPGVTDDERAEYNVPPLAEALRREKEMNEREAC